MTAGGGGKTVWFRMSVPCKVEAIPLRLFIVGNFEVWEAGGHANACIAEMILSEPLLGRDAEDQGRGGRDR